MTNNVQNAQVSDLLSMAKEVVEDVVNRSTIFDAACEASLPRFEDRELVLGRVIGRGGFCVIREINSIRSSSSGSFRGASALSSRSLRSQKSSVSNSSGRSSRKMPNLLSSFKILSERDVEVASTATADEVAKEFMIKTASRTGSKPRYVIKCVPDEAIRESRDRYIKGVIDLALEAKYLSALCHPNIMDIRGVSSTDPFEDGYFIVLDRLMETLPKKFKGWTTVDRQTKGVTGVFAGGKKKVDGLYVERLLVAFDIASALAYLHELNVVYRDLKPENIGFDNKGRTKLFDFGLAKELKDDERNSDGLYLLTGYTGSLRYMAPEVGLAQPYNEKADVYSFSILLWYIMALEPPFGMFTPKLFDERVFRLGHRPTIMDAWSVGIKQILNKCWNTSLDERPSFEGVMKMLKKEVATVAADVPDTMIHHSARQPRETSLDSSVLKSNEDGAT